MKQSIHQALKYINNLEYELFSPPVFKRSAFIFIVSLIRIATTFAVPPLIARSGLFGRNVGKLEIIDLKVFRHVKNTF